MAEDDSQPARGPGRGPLRTPAVLLAIAAVGFWLLASAIDVGWRRFAIGLFGGVLLLGSVVGFVAWWRSPRTRARLLPVRARARDLLGRSIGVPALARRLETDAEALRSFRPRYREVSIPKRRGGRRRLQVPDEPTKALQRRLLHRIFRDVPAHPAAYAFERGRSIAHQAAQHVGRAVLLRMDVVEFFRSTTEGRIERMFLRLGFSREAARLLARLTTHEGGLPQGAPTSPRLANLVNAGLDAELTLRLGRFHARYTRYADDVAVSFPEDWIGAPARVLSAVKTAFGRRGYRIHGRPKLSVRRRHERQEVCGLVVNRRVALPRDVRRRLRAVRHHLATGRSATLTPPQLAGWDAYAHMVATQGADVPPPFARARRPSAGWRRYRP